MSLFARGGNGTKNAASDRGGIRSGNTGKARKPKQRGVTLKREGMEEPLSRQGKLRYLL